MRGPSDDDFGDVITHRPPDSVEAKNVERWRKSPGKAGTKREGALRLLIANRNAGGYGLTKNEVAEQMPTMRHRGDSHPRMDELEKGGWIARTIEDDDGWVFVPTSKAMRWAEEQGL